MILSRLFICKNLSFIFYRPTLTKPIAGPAYIQAVPAQDACSSTPTPMLHHVARNPHCRQSGTYCEAASVFDPYAFQYTVSKAALPLTAKAPQALAAAPQSRLLQWRKQDLVQEGPS